MNIYICISIAVYISLYICTIIYICMYIYDIYFVYNVYETSLYDYFNELLIIFIGDHFNPFILR